MKAFRGQPSIFAVADSGDRHAELEVRKISLIFGGVTALKDIDLEVHTGELVSIIGPNGAGKTSLLNSITGFYKPQMGQILFNGEEITRLAPHEIVKRGIDAGRMETIGYGASKPVADNKTAAGKTQNRRVTIKKL